MAKTVIYFDRQFADGKRRLTLPDDIASALVRTGLAAAANPAEQGILAAGGALSLASPTLVVLEHGNPGATRLLRLTLPASVAALAIAAGIAARLIDPLPPLPVPTPPTGFVFVTDTDGAYFVDADGAYFLEAA